MSDKKNVLEAAVRPLQVIEDERLDRAGVSLLIKREDLIHPLVSGNKWHKLKYNLTAARQQGYGTLLSFGGAYSNHIHALAAAARAHGFQSVGVIRGEPYEPLNPTLQFAVEQGMRLHYLNRLAYRRKYEADILDALRARFGDFYLIPEGGSNPLGVRGCGDIVTDIDQAFDVLVCACGTGATLAGLVAGLEGRARALGIAVLKGAGFLNGEVRRFLAEVGAPACDNWSLALDFHCGGYAKTSPGLLAFMSDFERRHAIPLDPVYTGKMLYGLFELIGKGEFARGTTIVAIHSGGLQGRSGFGLQ